MPNPLSFRLALHVGAIIATASVCAEPVASTERPACAACHMADGAGQPEVGIPRLAGQSTSYVARQLSYFADGQRQNLVMHPYAAALSAIEKQSYGDYFAKMSEPASDSPLPPSEATLARGRHLYVDGGARVGLVACAQCHGPTGLGIGDFSPRLAGQSAVYVVEQLQGWPAGAMRDPGRKYMKIAARLSPYDMRDVAAFIATMKVDGRNNP